MTQTKTTIPPLDLSTEIDLLWDELNDAIQRVLRSGHFIMGSEVKQFEAEAADYLGVKHAVGLNSGTDALIIGLEALGVQAGDEVITSPFSFFATAEAISRLGANPVFVDIEPDTFNIDVSQIEAVVTEKTRAIIPVHLFGQSADMNALQVLANQHGLKILEDAAQGFGASYKGVNCGALGDVAAFSFYPTKNLGAYGDGGLLTTNDDMVAEQARMLRTHGSRIKYYNEILGYNSRLDAIQAAILRVKLPHIDDWNQARQRVAGQYHELLEDVDGVVIPTKRDNLNHIFHQYTIRVLDDKRDAVREHLKNTGISTMVYYPKPIHKLPMYTELDYELPITEQASREVLSLPIWPQLTTDTQETIVKALQHAIEQV